MKILHQLGHFYKWNLESYFDNGIGDGFIFGAFSFDSKTFHQKTISSKYDMERQVIPLSSIDLQYYGKAQSKDLGKFESYPFHPANYSGNDKTDVYGPEKISHGIRFQEQIGFNKIIIPNYFHDFEVKEMVSFLHTTNLQLKKKDDFEYFMTIPLSFQVMKNDESIERILTAATDKNINFDGYYVVAEPLAMYKQKLCVDYDYLENLYRFLKVLKKNRFKIIYGYANWDAILFTSLLDLDYVTIGTYENLRNFKIKRFREEVSGGGSKGAYFSKNVLNFIKQEELAKFRRKNALDLIRNSDNVFSDIILDDAYSWTSMHKPDVQKNYLLEISKLLLQIDSINGSSLKRQFVINSIKNAIDLYKNINERAIYLETESSDYHLETWLTFLQDK